MNQKVVALGNTRDDPVNFKKPKELDNKVGAIEPVIIYQFSKKRKKLSRFFG